MVIKAIIADDETPALDELSFLLNEVRRSKSSAG